MKAISPLTRTQQVFIDEYLKCFNATDAYMRVHPKCKRRSAWANASRLLADDRVKMAIQERLNEVHMSADEALKLLAEQARGDVAKLMDVTSMGFNLDMAKAEQGGLTKLIKKVKQKTTTIIGKKESDDDKEITELEVELYDAQAALDKILRVHGKYKDKVEISGAIQAQIGLKQIDYRADLTEAS